MKAFFSSNALSYTKSHMGGRLPEGLRSTLAYTPSRPPERVSIGWRIGGRYRLIISE